MAAGARRVMTWRFLVGEGIASLRRVPGASGIGAGLTGVALAIFGGLALLALAYALELDRTRGSVKAEIFLKEGVTEERAAAIAAEVSSFPEIADARLRGVAENRELLGLEETAGSEIPLPRTIAVEPAGESLSPATVDALRRRLQGIDGVEEIAFPDELLQRVEERLGSFLRLVIIVGIALGLSVIGAIAITAQLTVLSRRSTIRTMRLLGAESRWILAPFLVQGSLIGLAGGLLAAGGLWSCRFLLTDLDELLRRSSLDLWLLALPLLGLLLGGSGALMATRLSLRRI